MVMRCGCGCILCSTIMDHKYVWCITRRALAKNAFCSQLGLMMVSTGAIHAVDIVVFISIRSCMSKSFCFKIADIFFSDSIAKKNLIFTLLFEKGKKSNDRIIASTTRHSRGIVCWYIDINSYIGFCIK